MNNNGTNINNDNTKITKNRPTTTPPPTTTTSWVGRMDENSKFLIGNRFKISFSNTRTLRHIAIPTLEVGRGL